MYASSPVEIDYITGTGPSQMFWSADTLGTLRQYVRKMLRKRR